MCLVFVNNVKFKMTNNMCPKQLNIDVYKPLLSEIKKKFLMYI